MNTTTAAHCGPLLVVDKSIGYESATREGKSTNDDERARTTKAITRTGARATTARRKTRTRAATARATPRARVRTASDRPSGARWSALWKRHKNYVVRS